MTKISLYPEISVPDVDDLLIGTDVESSNKDTKNFTVQSIIDLAPTPTLQEVANSGNTTTTSINANSFVKTGGLVTQYLMADGSTSDGISQAYNSYVALLSCTNSSTVTTNLVFSDLGTVVWTRNSAGNYTGTLSGAFTIGKTLVFLTLNNGYKVGLTSTTNITQNVVNIEVFSTVNISNYIDYIENIAVEIRVYE